MKGRKTGKKMERSWKGSQGRGPLSRMMNHHRHWSCWVQTGGMISLTWKNPHTACTSGEIISEKKYKVKGINSC